MLSGMRTPAGSRPKSDTTTVCFVCGFGITARVSIAKSWRRAFVQAIGDCRASESGPNGSARGWYSGAKPERARKWNWRSLPESRMRILVPDVDFGCSGRMVRHREFRSGT